ncbi:MAG: tRNA preQ1(34) S-adenosylmethionine ribosyltransferase-isomerase QueA [Spiroplasma sp.]|nr:tRNA preQ1(34) S-adenosylmethionine ribosyltransferase-isomerase QueA [Mycoplasmatales bacterium]
MSKKIDDYNFELPEELIAQTPLSDRASSRLLVIDGESNVSHHSFSDIVSFLNSDDLLVLNNTRVIPARIIGEKQATGATIEFLLLSEKEPRIWECLVKPARKIKVGNDVVFGDGVLVGTCVSIGEDGIRNIEFKYKGIFLEVLEQLGSMPLPPYIKEKLMDSERYQTVYSKVPGSVAAPTAGLHFTPEILKEIEKKGIEIAFVTLDVGLGTFRPVSADDITNHKMHSEKYSIDDANAKIIEHARLSGKRIIAVGTTSIRTLESVMNKHGLITAGSESTDIFIYPGYKFQVVDALITNFHLPKSTLIMLISALLDRESILNSYEIAIKEKYRFFSFGDSMFINLEKEKNGDNL